MLIFVLQSYLSNSINSKYQEFTLSYCTYVLTIFDTFCSTPSVQACWTLCCHCTVLSIRKRKASPSGKRTRILCSDASRGRTLSRGGFFDRWQYGQSQAWPFSSSSVIAMQPQWKSSRQSSHCTIAPDGGFWQTHTLSAQQFSAGRSLDSFEARRANKVSISLWWTSVSVAICKGENLFNIFTFIILALYWKSGCQNCTIIIILLLENIKYGYTHRRGRVPALRESLFHVTQRLQFCWRFFADLRGVFCFFTSWLLMHGPNVTSWAKYLKI